MTDPTERAPPTDDGGKNEQVAEREGEARPQPIAGKIVDNLPGEFAGLAETPSEGATSQMIMQRLGASFMLQQVSMIHDLQATNQTLQSRYDVVQAENKTLEVALATTRTELRAEKATKFWRGLGVLLAGVLIPTGIQFWGKTPQEHGTAVLLVILGLTFAVASFCMKVSGPERRP